MRTLKISSLFFILQITLFAQWYQQNSGTQFNLNSIFFIDANIGWAVGDEGIILRTTNGGSDWITQSGVTTDNLYSVHFENNSVGWIVGENVRIMKSTDGGSTWISQSANPPFPVDLRSVQFLDLNNGWAVGHYMYSSTGYDSYIINTTNGGTTWENNFGFMDEKFYSVFFVNSNQGLVAGSEITRTTDGGSNWFTVFGSAFLDEFYSVLFIDDNNGWFVGKSGVAGVIYKSTNGGLNWTQQRSDTLQTYSSVFFSDANNGWSSGSGGKILYTSNSGTDWSFQSSGTNINLNSIFFTDNFTGWAAGNNGIILGTNNGGTPVELISFNAEYIQSENEVELNWSTATETNNSGFEILRITNDEVWNNIGFVPGHGTTVETQHYSFTDNNVKPGKYQYRLKQIDYDGTFEYSKTVEVEVPLVNVFSLAQNYPNPFNPVTKIKYTIPSATLRSPTSQDRHAQSDIRVILKVYDIFGKEVATLVNEEKPAGEYEVEFNAVSHSGEIWDLTSGIYFYQLQSGNFIETRKMILLK